MRMAFRADASHLIGGGHVMRCLTLATLARERGHAVVFVCRELPGHLGPHIERCGFELHLLPAPGGSVESRSVGPSPADGLAVSSAEDARQTIERLGDQALDAIVVDHYALDAGWLDPLRARWPGLRSLAIDDLDDRQLGADLVLDQTRAAFAPRRYRPLCLLGGARYALLKPAFAALRASALARRRSAGAVRRLLVTPGMADTRGLAMCALHAAEAFGLAHIDVALGQQAPSWPDLRAWAAGHPNVHLHPSTPDMARLIHDADLAIGAGGMSIWERCCLGLPSVTVCVAENQRAGAQGLAALGATILLPDAAIGDPAALRAAVAPLLADPQRLRTLSERAAALCDGLGAQRVLDAMAWELRAPQAADGQRLFDWRNAERVRAMSLNAEPLDAAAHAAWFERVMTRSDGRWRIYREGGRDLGFVHAVDLGDGCWRWGFHIGAADAPPGAGGRMMANFLQDLFSSTGAREVVAEVLDHNAHSLHLHRRMGFVAAETAAPGRWQLRLRRSDWVRHADVLAQDAPVGGASERQ